MKPEREREREYPEVIYFTRERRCPKPSERMYISGRIYIYNIFQDEQFNQPLLVLLSRKSP